MFCTSWMFLYHKGTNKALSVNWWAKFGNLCILLISVTTNNKFPLQKSGMVGNTFKMDASLWNSVAFCGPHIGIRLWHHLHPPAYQLDLGKGFRFQLLDPVRRLRIHDLLGIFVVPVCSVFAREISVRVRSCPANLESGFESGVVYRWGRSEPIEQRPEGCFQEESVCSSFVTWVSNK